MYIYRSRLKNRGRRQRRGVDGSAGRTRSPVGVDLVAVTIVRYSCFFRVESLDCDDGFGYL